MGIETREVWHKTDWSKFKKNKEYVQLPQPEWIFGHDPQKYAYEEFETAAHAVRTGGPYEPRNVPPPGSDTRTHDFDPSKKSLTTKDPATFSTHMTAHEAVVASVH
jgi:hypothetical protein